MLKFFSNGKVRLILILICVAIIIYESIGLYNDSQEYEVAETEYETLVNDSITVATPEEIAAAAARAARRRALKDMEDGKISFKEMLQTPYN